jgi:hypothetical protein
MAQCLSCMARRSPSELNECVHCGFVYCGIKDCQPCDCDNHEILSDSNSAVIEFLELITKQNPKTSFVGEKDENLRFLYASQGIVDYFGQDPIGRRSLDLSNNGFVIRSQRKSVIALQIMKPIFWVDRSEWLCCLIPRIFGGHKFLRTLGWRIPKGNRQVSDISHYVMGSTALKKHGH